MPAELVEVLELVSAGSTNAEVGRQLGRSEYWAAERMRSIMRRLEARDRAHAVALAIGAGLIRPPRPEQHVA
jgi:DNA-binding NarL/FixJ family response regulator